MCGIIGIAGIENCKELAEAGVNLMRYRGKDGNGIIAKISAKQTFAFGHCLHSIVGNVKQPIGDNNILTANCEIYNWGELKQKYFTNAEIDFRNDADVLYYLLEKFGVEKTLELIDGDYACAYYKDNLIYLFRDLIGVKPLWYSNEKGFVFASEKKVLEKLGFNNIKDLNPRKILVYDLIKNEINFIERRFFDLKLEHSFNYEKIKNDVKGLLINSIAKRVPDCKFGLLFSGGVDSSFIAMILKELGVDFECYICVLDDENMSDAKDLENAQNSAKELGLKLNIVKIKINDVENNISNVINIIESSNVVKVGVALPFYFASKKAREDGCKVIFSGLGSEEIFAGYERHKNTDDVNKECYSGLLWIYERDLYRDDAITMINNVELRVPFLDYDLISYALKIPSNFKIANNVNKKILREIALDIGLGKEFAFRKKIAAQYGSNFDKAIGKLSKLNNFKSKSEYLNNFYNKPNIKLGVLFSGGKDSCYAMHIMHRQNYSIDCLISIKSQNEHSFMFHTPNIDFVKMQAEALGIPLIFGNTKGDKEEELEDLKKIIEDAVEKYNINGVVTGALFSNYQRERIEKICDGLGLKVFSPLWHKNQSDELKELVKEGFEIIIVNIAADGFNSKWLGRKLDYDSINELEKLHVKNKINIAFEGGEAETFVLNAPMFKKKINIIDYEVIMFDEHSGIYKIKDAELIEKS